MPKTLLDTDILSEYLKGHDSNVIRHAVSYYQAYGVFTFTSVTVHEIVYGLEFKSAHSQLNKALQWLQQNEELVPSAADYISAALIKANARKKGIILELPDCLIASVAVRLNLILITGNTTDLKRSGRPALRSLWKIGAIRESVNLFPR